MKMANKTETDAFPVEGGRSFSCRVDGMLLSLKNEKKRKKMAQMLGVEKKIINFVRFKGCVMALCLVYIRNKACCRHALTRYVATR